MRERKGEQEKVTKGEEDREQQEEGKKKEEDEEGKKGEEDEVEGDRPSR